MSAGTKRQRRPIHENDPATAAALFNDNQPLAHWIANGFRRKALAAHVDMDDVRQAGLVGLWQAAVRFDSSRGFKFCTYATVGIRNTILKHFSEDAKARRLKTCNNEAEHEHALAKPDQSIEPDVPGILDRAIRKLKPRERRIIRQRYGLRRGERRHSGDTMEAIAKRHGVTKQAIDQSLARALRDLRYVLGTTNL
jgi:RNA polymerase sigma factor (sigma-70 family)